VVHEDPSTEATQKLPKERMFRKKSICLGLGLGVALYSPNVLAEAEAEADGPKSPAPTELENNPGEKSKAFEPEIYADISDEAKQNAVSFGGTCGLFGIAASVQKYSASTRESKSNPTGNSINSFSLSLGAEYTKACRKNLLLAVTILADLSPKGKKTGDWKSLNAGYDAAVVGAGQRTGTLETAKITPSMFLKVGYHILKHKMAVFLKIGMSRVHASYNYFLAGEKKCDVAISAFNPMFGAAVMWKINKKWGISTDLEIPVKKTFKKTENGIEHQLKAGAINLRLVGILTLSKPIS
jgi:hypothetical protein